MIGRLLTLGISAASMLIGIAHYGDIQTMMLCFGTSGIWLLTYYVEGYINP